MQPATCKYTCRFKFTVFAGLTRVEPAVQIISPVKNQIIKYRNQSVLFNCTVNIASATHGAKFQWLRNGTRIMRTGKKDTPFWSSFVLREGLHTQDEGEYKCIYGIFIGSDSVTVHLAGT